VYFTGCHRSYRHSYDSTPEWFINNVNNQIKVNTMLYCLTIKIVLFIVFIIIVIVSTIAIYHSAPVQALIGAAEITYKGAKASKNFINRVRKTKRLRKP